MAFTAHFLKLALPSLAAIGLVGTFVVRGEIDHEVETLRAADREMVREVSAELLSRTREAVTHTLYLSRMAALNEALDPPPVDAAHAEDAAAHALDHLADHLAAFVENIPGVDQVRWLDERGMEKLRINNQQNWDHVALAAVAPAAAVPSAADALVAAARVRRVPQDELQDKSDRPYFTQTMALGRGTMHLSPLNLNEEQGAVEVPHKPTLRLSAPLFDGQGVRRGVLVVNYTGLLWLEKAAQLSQTRREHLMLLNGSGHWLLSSDKADEWGVQLGHSERTLANRNPAAWDAIRSRSTDHAILTDGLWVWALAAPLQAHTRDHLHAETLGMPQHELHASSEHAWYVVSHHPQAELLQHTRAVWLRWLWLLGTLAVVALAVAWLLARNRMAIERLNIQLQDRALAAEAAARTKAAFLANMSHEIRTPMNAVLGIVYLLEQARLSEDARLLVRKVRLASRSLQRIIDDILDFSRIESGRLKIESTPFRLDDVLDSLSNVMTTLAVSKDIEVSISPPPIAVGEIAGDALRLEQVLVNLVSNAIKFTAHGNVALVVTVQSRTDAALTLRFVVRDTGIGMDEGALQDIFKPFTQADGSTTRRFGGTGLGLAISRQLVSMMGGELKVSSVPAVGSEFCFELEFAATADTQWSAPEMTGLTVWVADDNPIAREALRLTAAGLGWSVRVAESGEDLLARIAAAPDELHDKDVVLLDWRMPGMSGLDVARHLHEEWPDVHEATLLLVTAYFKAELMRNPEVFRLDGVLTKPVTASALYDAVAHAKREPTLLAEEPTALDSHGPRLQGVRLLVVDDSDINREVAQRIFNGEGATVYTANDGQQALDWLRQHNAGVDLVLMDVQMPVMDGHTATRAIRATPEWARLPVVALSAGVFDEQKAAASAAGMDGYIPKPFDVDLAVATIQRLTGHVPQASEGRTDVVSQPDSEHAQSPELAGLVVAQGLKVWREADAYQRYLRRFAQEHAEAVLGLRALAQTDVVAVAAEAHKLKGAAANLALPGVAAAAAELERAATVNVPLGPELDALQAALDTALVSIRRYAPMPDPALTAGARVVGIAAEAAPPLNDAQLRERLTQLLAACGTHDPVPVETLLAELLPQLGAAALEPVRMALESFDFAAAAQVASKMIQSLETKETKSKEDA